MKQVKQTGKISGFKDIEFRTTCTNQAIFGGDHKNILNSDTVEKFVFAGKSFFTVRNLESGNRLTFRVKKLDEGKSWNKKPLWFVSVLVGSDNTSNYSFIGTNFDHTSFKHSKKSRITSDAQAVKVWNWLTKRWHLIDSYPNLEVWHEGRCGRCGRKLTVPESIESGFGPECVHLINRKFN